MRLAFVRISITIILSICVSAFAVDAIQTKAPELTELHKLRLQLDQKDAIIANNQFQAAQQNLQNSISKFNQDCEGFKKDDHYPEKAVCDLQNATINMPAAETAKTPEPPTPPKK